MGAPTANCQDWVVAASVAVAPAFVAVAAGGLSAFGLKPRLVGSLAMVGEVPPLQREGMSWAKNRRRQHRRGSQRRRPGVRVQRRTPPKARAAKVWRALWMRAPLAECVSGCVAPVATPQ